MEITHLAVLVASAIFSTFYIPRIWKDRFPLSIKILFTLLVYFPILGPVFFTAILDEPDVQPFDFQDRTSKYDHGDARGTANFDNRWRDRIQDLRKRIDELRKQIDADQS